VPSQRLTKKIEHNLEAFLFSMGILAVTLDTFLLNVTSNEAGEILPNWNLTLIEKAMLIQLRSPWLF